LSLILHPKRGHFLTNARDCLKNLPKTKKKPKKHTSEINCGYKCLIKMVKNIFSAPKTVYFWNDDIGRPQLNPHPRASLLLRIIHLAWTRARRSRSNACIPFGVGRSARCVLPARTMGPCSNCAREGRVLEGVASIVA
jgi:hypothetical protein